MSFQFPPRLMQAKAAAHYLGVSTTKFRNLNLPCKDDGGNVFYDRADLDAWADGLPYRNDEGEKVENPFDQWKAKRT